MTMYTLHVTDHFSAAHQLNGYEGKCENLHGHNWRVDISVYGDTLTDTGFLIDFKELKRILRTVLERFDHQYLNDVPPFQHTNPTAEQIAREIFTDTAQRLPAHVAVGSVTVWESHTSSCTYHENTEESSV